MLNNKSGNCYDFACAFAALAKGIGYNAYVVYGQCPSASGGMTAHGWVYIPGRGYFDPEGAFAHWSSIYGAG